MSKKPCIPIRINNLREAVLFPASNFTALARTKAFLEAPIRFLELMCNEAMKEAPASTPSWLIAFELLKLVF